MNIKILKLKFLSIDSVCPFSFSFKLKQNILSQVIYRKRAEKNIIFFVKSVVHGVTETNCNTLGLIPLFCSQKTGMNIILMPGYELIYF